MGDIMLTRVCKQCQKTIVYKSKSGFQSATKRDSVCRSCTVKNDYIKHPEKNKGKLNGRTGKSLIGLMKAKHGENFDKAYAKWKSSLGAFKKGKDNPGYGRPGFENSGRSYKGWYKGLFFRSSLELFFIFQYEKQNDCIPVSAEGKFRIKYGDKNYIPDFFCPITNTIYEIKCFRFLKDNTEKFEAGKDYCNTNNLNYSIITEKDIIDFKTFDALVFNLKQLHLDKTIKLTDKSIQKLEKRLKCSLG